MIGNEIKIERKVWGAPVNSRGDSVIEFTSGISREADDYGMPLNGSLPQDHAVIFAFMRPSGRLTMVIAQGDYTRFEGMGRRYNMRAVAEMGANDVKLLKRPLRVMLDHLDVIHDYDTENRQVSAAVTVVEPSAPRLTGDNRLTLANAIALAVLDDHKVYIKLPREDALFGDKMRHSGRLAILLDVLDAMPATVRQQMGLAFGVEDGFNTMSRFIDNARVVAHFGSMAIADSGDIIIDWTGDDVRVQGPARSGTAAQAFDMLVKRERKAASPITRPIRAGEGPETDIIVHTSDGDGPSEGAGDDGNWTRWWRALVQSGPLPAIIALVCLLCGAALGRYFALQESSPRPTARHDAVITADTSIVVQTLVQQRQYSLTDSLNRTMVVADTLTGDIAFDHPMTHIANWNLEALFRTNHINVALKMRLRNDSLYADTAMTREIDKQRLMALDNAYYDSLGQQARDDEFASDCTLTLSNGSTITISPDNSLLRQAIAMDNGTMVQIRSLSVAGKTFTIDNDAFQRLNGGVKRGLNMPVYYLWVVTQLEQCRNNADVNKLFAY